MSILYRSLESERVASTSGLASLLGHPVFALMHLRPVIAQHSKEENEVLRKWASGKRTLVEIGVAEGASGLALRQAMDADAVLYLIDPFHLSRIPLLNSEKRVARRTVAGARNGRVVWLNMFSFDAVRGWTTPVDFLFIDGDHSESAVRKDWDDWKEFVIPGGIVAFHDAKTFPGGWTTPSYGSVVVVDRLFRSKAIRGWTVVDEIHSLVIVQRR